MHCNITDIKLQ